jgi:protein-S-isoprenylcysteine O-methyltransferase Ste14
MPKGITMIGWIQRWNQRQRDLTQGVDADLVRENRKRYKLAFGLQGLALFLILLCAKVHIASTLFWILSATAIVSFLAGLLLAIWAQQEDAFLSKPDPEEPPRIFKRK